MQIKPVNVLIGLGLLLATVYQPAQAQTAPGTLAEEWHFTVKDGHQADFEQAIRAHGKVRRDKGDPRRWDVYTPVTGDDLNTYVFRACCFTWNDQDAYAAWESSNADVESDWLNGPGQHVAKTAHYFSEIDLANSYWPDNDKPVNYLGVMDYYVGAGQGAPFAAARAELSQIAINQGWSAAGHRWSWIDRIGGKAVNFLVVPFANYAGMQSGGETFIEFLGEHLGDEAALALQTRFAGAISGSKYTIWRYRSDLAGSSN